MNAVFTTEQQDLRATVRGLLAEQAPEAKVRSTMVTENGCDAALWRRMTTEMGLSAIAIPEALGGAGAGMVELGVVMEEMGRALYCGPFLSATVATLTLLEMGDAVASAELLPGIASGELRATVASDALLAPAGMLTAPAPTVRNDGGSSVLEGTVEMVLDGLIADVFLVPDRQGDVFLVHRSGPAVTVEPLATLDPTRRLARVTFAGAPARRLAGTQDSARLLIRIRNLSMSLLAAEQVGGAQRMLDVAVDHARVRTQFGRTIGSFQAVKHRCANMSIELEAARSAAYDSIWTSTQSPERNAIAAAVAHSYCSEAFVDIAGSAIQVLGGIGFTWEHAAHLYYRRAKGSEHLFGSPWWHRRQLAALLGIGPEECPTGGSAASSALA